MSGHNPALLNVKNEYTDQIIKFLPVSSIQYPASLCLLVLLRKKTTMHKPVIHKIVAHINNCKRLGLFT